MRKDILLQLIKTYEKTRTSPRITLLKRFLDSEGIQKQSDDYDILFTDFIAWANSNTEEMKEPVEKKYFTEEYLNSGSESAKIFNQFISSGTAGKLSLTSHAFFGEMKSASDWRNKIISAGCPAKVIDEVIQSRSIHDYSKLYRHFLTYKKCFAMEKISTSWELLCLSGELAVISKIIEKIPHDQQKNALFIIAVTGNAAAIKAAATKFGMNSNIHEDDSDSMHEWREDDSDSMHEWQNVLYYTACSGIMDAINTVISELGVAADKTDYRGRNALHGAALSGITETILAVFKLGVKPIIDDEGLTVLHYAAWSGNAETIQPVVQILGVKPTIGMSEEIKAKIKHFEKKRKIEFKIDGISLGNIGRSVLHCAAQSGSAKTVLEVAKLEIDPMICDLEGRNALHYAAESGNIETIQVVFKLGAKPILAVPAETKLLMTVMTVQQAMLPFWEDSSEEEVFEENPKIHGVGISVLHCAVLSDNVEAVQAVAELEGVDPMVIDPDGDTALHYAVRSCNAETIIRALIKIGVDPALKNKEEKNVLHLAAWSGNVEAIRVLGKFVDPTILDYSGCNALHYAARSGNVDAINAVLDLGVDPTIRDKGGRNALHHALDSGRGSIDAIRVLIERGVDDLHKHKQDFSKFLNKAFETDPEKIQKILFIRRLCFERNVDITNIISKLSEYKHGEILNAFQVPPETIPPTGIHYKDSAGPNLKRLKR